MNVNDKPIQFYVNGNNANHQSIISTNFPLPQNAPQNNRNVRGMDVGVKRIDFGIVNHFQREFANSLLGEKNTANGFIDFIQPVDSAIDIAFFVQHLKNFDTEWHKRSLEYVENLSIKDQYMLRAYTRNGDEMINALIRKYNAFESDPKIMELVRRCIIQNSNNVIAVQIFEELGFDPERFIEIKGGNQQPAVVGAGLGHLIDYVAEAKIEDIKKHIAKLATEIKRIIGAAPPLTKKIKLFRGVKTDYTANNDINRSIDTQQCVLYGFQSMSYATSVAISFAGQYNEENLQHHHMIYSFTLHPGVPCIAMEGISHFPEECEILVDMNMACQYNYFFNEKIHLNSLNYQYYQLFTGVVAYPFNSFYIKNLIIAPLLRDRGARNNSSSFNANSNTQNTSRNNFIESPIFPINAESVHSSNLNAAMHEYGYNGYGGRILSTKTRKNLNLSRNLGKTIRNIKQKNIRVNKMNKVNNANKRNNVEAVMKRIEAIEAKETDYRKVRDPGLGFIIVKDEKVPAASKKLLAQMKSDLEL